MFHNGSAQWEKGLHFTTVINKMSVNSLLFLWDLPKWLKNMTLCTKYVWSFEQCLSVSFNQQVMSLFNPSTKWQELLITRFCSQAAHVDIFPNKSSLQLKIREVRQKVMGQYPPTMTPSGLASPMASSTDSAATTPGMFMAILFSMWRCIEKFMNSLLEPITASSTNFWD